MMPIGAGLYLKKSLKFIKQINILTIYKVRSYPCASVEISTPARLGARHPRYCCAMTGHARMHLVSMHENLIKPAVCWSVYCLNQRASFIQASQDKV
jgi:hypothetical protein